MEEKHISTRSTEWDRCLGEYIYIDNRSSSGKNNNNNIANTFVRSRLRAKEYYPFDFNRNGAVVSSVSLQTPYSILVLGRQWTLYTETLIIIIPSSSTANGIRTRTRTLLKLYTRQEGLSVCPQTFREIEKGSLWWRKRRPGTFLIYLSSSKTP